MNRDSRFRRNKINFGLGTIGRDMVYSLVSAYLIVYITEAVGVSNRELLTITAIMMAARIFDAVNDPFMGVIVDNTKSPWGKHKPWIAGGAVVSGFLTCLLFLNTGLRGSSFIVFFGIVYVLWGIAYTTNDISYWSMMPCLSYDQKEREEIGSFARICANIGLFIVVGSIIPVTKLLGNYFGDQKYGYSAFAVIVSIVLVGGQSLTIFGVKTPPSIGKSDESKTGLRDMLRALFKNDQLLWTGIAMALFMIGYITTTSFGVYYFKYAYKNEGMYSIFAIVLGVSQITALAIFPVFSKRFTRKQIFTVSTLVVIFAYVLFFFAPMNIFIIGIAGVLLFAAEAFIQLLMLVYLADTIDYGHWKLGKRNESVSFAIQPFINKIGAAIGNGILGLTLVVSGINEIPKGGLASSRSLLIMKFSMMILPLCFILVSFIIHRKKYVIDEKRYSEIIKDLKAEK